jgi:4-hydroxybenzoate polyprenyltransferase
MQGNAFVRFLTFIRFSHTIFALPFALGAMVVAAKGWPSARIFGLILLAMAFARTAAMTFNRLADWEIDKRNPRTVGRHKLVSRKTAVVGLVTSAGLFLLTSWFINRLCFYFAPIALFVLCFYSITKRFTSLAQFFLGIALGLSPIGAWMAVKATLELPPFVLALGVMLWVAGFDMIYACQDVEVDKKEGLKSMVVWLGVDRSLVFAQVLHGIMFLLLVAFGVVAGLGKTYFASLSLVVAALIYEHRVARKLDMAAINAAFFNSNAFVSLVFVLAVIADRCLPV